MPRLEIKEVKFIPISALNGDKRLTPSPTIRAVTAGPTLLGHLRDRCQSDDRRLANLVAYPYSPCSGVNRQSRPTIRGSDPELARFPAGE